MHGKIVCKRREKSQLFLPQSQKKGAKKPDISRYPAFAVGSLLEGRVGHPRCRSKISPVQVSGKKMLTHSPVSCQQDEDNREKNSCQFKSEFYG